MSTAQDPDEFYAKLKEQLSNTSLWPSPYLFKFIVPTNVDKIKQITSFFDHKGCLLYTSPSPRDKRQSRMPSSA